MITVQILNNKVVGEVCIPKKPDGLYEVTLRKIYKDRSIQQNRYYWFIIGILSTELGYTPEEVHEVFKDRLLTKIYHPNKNKRIKLKRVKSTTDLTTIEFEEYLSKIRAFALQKLQINIPLPNQTEFNY